MVTRPYLNLLVKPKICPGFLEKYNFMHFERRGEMPFKMNKVIFFPGKKCVPTLSKIFRPVTWNTLIFLFGLNTAQVKWFQF